MKSSRTLSRALIVLLKSKRLLRAMTALFGLFLLSQLTACVRTETKYVPVQPVPLPAELTADCPAPEIADPFTWGDSLALNELLLTALENCNVDKAKIREIEQQRQTITKDKP
nr:MAG TPA: hypothetical protein [Caudoviricetes sp.]